MLAKCYLLLHPAVRLNVSVPKGSWLGPAFHPVTKVFYQLHEWGNFLSQLRLASYNLSYLVLEYFPLSRFRFLALLLNQPMRTNFMSLLNPVNPTYFEEEKMGGSVKAVTSHSSSDSFSRGTQLNHISFTEIHSLRFIQSTAVRGAGSVEGAGQVSSEELPTEKPGLVCLLPGMSPTNQFQFHKPVQFQKPVYSYQLFFWPD